MTDIVIVNGARTAMGGFQGSLSGLTAPELGAVTIKEAIARAGFDSFVIKEGKDVQEAAAGLQDFTNPYQASTAVPQASYQTGA
ncbi:DUF934 domain-containing protein [Acinetobacter baumannii]